MLNGGTAAITSMNMHWNLNNGPVYTSAQGALNIAPSSYYNYTHPTTWNAASNGTYVLKIWASNINGGGDQWTMNDTLTQLVYVHTNPRVVFVEEFTNTDCPPCATQNPAFDALLMANRTAGKVSMVKYHAPWPGPLDPMNNFNPTDVSDRLYYYGSLGLPNALMNGIYLPVNNACTVYGFPECLEYSKYLPDRDHEFHCWKQYADQCKCNRPDEHS